MNVRCPACGAGVALAVGDTRLACAACGLATPVSRVGTEPGAALVALERDLVGATIGGYEVGERIGAGGMGTVYRARRVASGDGGSGGGGGGDGHGGDGSEVAIKVLRPGVGGERAAVLARFAREAAALRRLDHPRVVRFLGHGEEGDVAYIVTELVKGTDLAARLARGRLAMAEIVEIFGQVCDGVAAAHAAGIVHRDLKPANILVGEGGAVKVADFGLAQLGPDASITTLTRTDVAMGTFHYLAPEQRKDARNVDQRADVWALGVIFYEMLTGELPLGSFAPASDRRADTIVRKALAPGPDARFASVEALGRAVRALVAPRRGPRVWIAAAAALVLAMGTAGAVAMSSSGGGGDDGKRTVASASQIVDGKDKADGKAGRAASAGDRAKAVDPKASDPKAAEQPALDEKSPIAAPPTDEKGASKPPTVRASKRPTSVSKPSKPGKIEKRPSKPIAGDDAADEDASDGPSEAAGDAPSDGSDAPSKPPTPSKQPVLTKSSGKGKVADKPPAICATARRCCQVTKGSRCDALMLQDAGQCTSALAGFRSRATNPKQIAACGGEK